LHVNRAQQELAPALQGDDSLSGSICPGGAIGHRSIVLKNSDLDVADRLSIEWPTLLRRKLQRRNPPTSQRKPQV
jgi:hypothetical protein